jgi:hypothetical protein
MKKEQWLLIAAALLPAGLLIFGGVKAWQMTRGLRNNNPGNIKASDSFKWQGEVGRDGPFVKFDTPVNGIRAMLIIALGYPSRHGVRNLNEFGNIWAPPSDNEGASDYGANLAKRLRVDAETTPFMYGYDAIALGKAICRNENTVQPYSDDIWQQGQLLAYSHLEARNEA